MKNNDFIILTEENATTDLVKRAFDSTAGIHYDESSPIVKTLIANETKSILDKKRMVA